MEVNAEFWSDEGMIDNPTEYRRIVGSLQYLMLSHPDIEFTVGKLSQFMKKPQGVHWIAM